MTVKSTAVTVGTTPTRLDTVSEVPAAVSPLTGQYASGRESIAGQSVAVYNDSAVTVYLGGADVTTANGAPVAASSWGPGIDLHDPTEALYGIVATGTAAVRVLEVGI